MIRAGLIACALVAAASAGCKKSEKPGVAPGSGGSGGSATTPVATGSGSATAGGVDPWGGPPTGGEQMPDKMGEKTGAGLAAVDATSISGLAAKVELTSIEKPVEKASIKGFGTVKESGFRVTYNPSKNAAHEQYKTIFQQGRVFEKVAEGLNSTVRLPGTIDINTVDCGTINAFYDPGNKRIIVCYELLDYFLGVFKPHIKDETQLGNAVMGATMFTFFHETGHGLIDVLDLAAVGREEDSVDQLATLILIAAGDEGIAMALSGAHWFQLQTQGDNKTPFWDEHAFDGQRFYNLICLIYGSNPEKFASFVKSGNLPEARAARCSEEYRKINKAWEKLLQPHFTNGAANNVDYKPTVSETEAPKSTKEDPWGDGPSGDSTPTTEPPPATPPASSPHAITCEQVATRAAELIVATAEEQAKQMTPEQIEELKARLEAEMPAAIEQILATCAKESWTDASRKCVVEASTLDQATKCN